MGVFNQSRQEGRLTPERREEYASGDLFQAILRRNSHLFQEGILIPSMNQTESTVLGKLLLKCNLSAFQPFLSFWMKKSSKFLILDGRAGRKEEGKCPGNDL